MSVWMDAAFLGALTESGFADPDVNTWITNVQAADGQALERQVTDAMNTLVTGIKTDGDWIGINTLVVLNAARTLSGMAIAVKGTNVGTLTNFSSGDLVRGRGLTSNGVDKWGSTNVPQNAYGSATAGYIGAHVSNWADRGIPTSRIHTLMGSNNSTNDFSRIVMTNLADPFSPSSADAFLNARLRSSSTMSTQTSPVALGAQVCASISRSSGNSTVKTYSPTGAINFTAAHTATTPSSAAHLLMAAWDMPNSLLNGSLASYVFGSETTANVDRIMPRLVTFTTTLRAFFGN